ncbi:RNA polymerase sigma-38 subunit RpoS [Nitzschia inconspicua]|uniref:RNA polymerase sigma-38 subunit RpoS n=1 Tax=Nitzschia inconspicua TaxID=303405 RepID=A0A9K3KPC8_9STRA|nr:RNA polymerase sigma-38 subunit RpoS [Nitzschia inconspicua]
MRYSTSSLLLTVLVLQISASPRMITAFVPPTRGCPPHRMISLKIATQSSSQNRFEDILEDHDGRINPELAQRIWKWERQQRLNLNLPDFQSYSTRDGLRWVKEMVDATLGKATATSRGVRKRSPPNHDDLIQEGVIGLMQAFKTFEHQSQPNESFEDFAKATIRQALQSYTLERAKGTGTGPSYVDGSNTKHRRPPPLSMESTVEIADPLETERYYFNQDEWDVREGLVLDDGKSLKREELVEDYLDESLQYEGEDQMWIHEQSVAAPLRDSIPESRDDEANRRLEDLLSNPTSPDDLALTDMILYNVDDFLGKTLEEVEVQVIQMRFGLDDGVPKTQKEISFELGLTVSQVRKHQKKALEKLRATFTDQYASDQSSREDFWEDTV